MLWLFLTVIGLTVVGILVAEFSGYIIHILLHIPPEWFEKRRFAKVLKFLTRSHMGHHGLGYGPRMLQRPSPKYFFVRNPGATESKKTRFGWLLPEFTIPGTIFFALYVTGLYLSGLSFWWSIYALAVTSFWVGFTFLYVHDAFHKTDHWLGKIPGVRVWFHYMKEAHDRHHMIVNENGMVPYNIGISTPFMDWLFGSWISWPENMRVSDRIGQLESTPIPDANYAKFHEVYQIEEPAFDMYASDEIRPFVK